MLVFGGLVWRCRWGSCGVGFSCLCLLMMWLLGFDVF